MIIDQADNADYFYINLIFQKRIKKELSTWIIFINPKSTKILLQKKI